MDSGPALGAVWLVALTEAGLGLMVLFGWRRAPALRGMLCLLGVFSAYLAWGWAQGHRMDCGCMGNLPLFQHPLAAIARNAVLAAVAWAALPRSGIKAGKP